MRIDGDGSEGTCGEKLFHGTADRSADADGAGQSAAGNEFEVLVNVETGETERGRGKRIDTGLVGDGAVACDECVGGVLVAGVGEELIQAVGLNGFVLIFGGIVVFCAAEDFVGGAGLVSGEDGVACAVFLCVIECTVEDVHAAVAQSLEGVEGRGERELVVDNLMAEEDQFFKCGSHLVRGSAREVEIEGHVNAEFQFIGGPADERRVRRSLAADVHHGVLAVDVIGGDGGVEGDLGGNRAADVVDGLGKPVRVGDIVDGVGCGRAGDVIAAGVEAYHGERVLSHLEGGDIDVVNEQALRRTFHRS